MAKLVLREHVGKCAQNYDRVVVIVITLKLLSTDSKDPELMITPILCASSLQATLDKIF